MLSSYTGNILPAYLTMVTQYRDLAPIELLALTNNRTMVFSPEMWMVLLWLRYSMAPDAGTTYNPMLCRQGLIPVPRWHQCLHFFGACITNSYISFCVGRWAREVFSVNRVADLRVGLFKSRGDLGCWSQHSYIFV